MKITELFPMKSQFLKGEEISFQFQLIGTERNVTTIAEIWDLDILVASQKIRCSPDTKEYTFSFPFAELKMEEEQKGYILTLQLKNENEHIEDYKYTGFDVATAHNKSIRYGFLTDFHEENRNDKRSIEWMNKFHINYLQYYDWMYKHDRLVPEEESYTDLLGRKLSRENLKNRIAQAKEYNMRSIAYGAIYGATNEMFEAHPEWALYDFAGKHIKFFDFLNIMNVEKKSGWHNHLLKEYKKTIEFGFDGIHMDTYGFPKEAYSYEKEKLNLAQNFGDFIDDTNRYLSTTKDDVSLIFNNVGNWPVNTVANRKQDAIYIEVWDPNDSYTNIREVIQNARMYNTEKPIILAAYLKPFEGMHIEEAQNAALLLTAIITILGATHLLIGEYGGILTEGYYVKYYQNESKKFEQQLRKYYDYVVALSHLWCSEKLRDVSFTHFQGDNKEYYFEGEECSPNFTAKKMWIQIRESEYLKMINFVNLTGSKDIIWNKEKEISTSRTIKVKCLVMSQVEVVLLTSPDRTEKVYQKLSYTYDENENGSYLVFEIPKVYIWSTIIIKMKQTE